MDFSAIIEDLKAKKLAGRCYEKTKGRFRDSITIRRDGAIFFKRYNYGEAAGLVFEMKGGGIDPDGTLQWDWASTEYSKKEEAAPRRLTGAEGDQFFFDEGSIPWAPKADLKTMPGMGRMKVLFGGR